MLWGGTETPLPRLDACLFVASRLTDPVPALSALIPAGAHISGPISAPNLAPNEALYFPAGAVASPARPAQHTTLTSRHTHTLGASCVMGMGWPAWTRRWPHILDLSLTHLFLYLTTTPFAQALLGLPCSRGLTRTPSSPVRRLLPFPLSILDRSSSPPSPPRVALFIVRTVRR